MSVRNRGGDPAPRRNAWFIASRRSDVPVGKRVGDADFHQLSEMRRSPNT